MSGQEVTRAVQERAGIPGRAPRWWRRRWVQVSAGLVVTAGIGLGTAAEYVLHHAEPIVRKRLIETLAESFDGPVQLDEVHISLWKGLQVEGHGLRVPYGSLPEAEGGSAKSVLRPLLSIETFRFRTTVGGLMRRVTHVDSMQVDGVELHIPRGEERARLLGPKEGTGNADPLHPRLKPKIAFTLGEVEATNAKLFIETDKLQADGTRKNPLEFDIRRIDLKHVGPNDPCVYTAELTNAKPKGEISATGHIGPWNGTNPRATHIDGTYRFEHADLNTINGIGGTLFSTGHFDGPLQRIAIEGETNVPNFSIDVANRPVPLHTHFQAHVDGTDGDTYLERVDARLLQSSFTTSGKVVKVAGQGHDISLDVKMDHGRMQDLLLLGVKTQPPLMNGVLAMQAKLHLPPGPVRVIQKLDLRGHFTLREVRFNNAKFQDRVDGLSARAQGRPQEVALASRNRVAEVGSQMSADFTLVHGLLTAENVRYRVPGALVLLHGVYSTDGNVFEFKGHARTEARASQMVSGWKSWLLKPVDPFLARHGAGVEVPIEVSGTEGDMHLGLALKDADQSSASMVGDLKGKRAEAKANRRARRQQNAEARAPQRTAAAAMQTEREQRRALFAAEANAKGTGSGAGAGKRAEPQP